jgi:hypothetical protein
LHIGEIILLLCLVTIALPCTGTSCCAEKETRATADGRTSARVSGSGSDKGACACTDGRSYDRPGHRILVRHLLSGKADLLPCPLSTKDVVSLEVLERFPLGGQHEDTWP